MFDVNVKGTKHPEMDIPGCSNFIKFRIKLCRTCNQTKGSVHSIRVLSKYRSKQIKEWALIGWKQDDINE